jgi:hypothetical protein
MTEMPPGGSEELETLDECLVFASVIEEWFATIALGYGQIANFGVRLNRTYASLEGGDSANAGSAMLVKHVADQALVEISKAWEMNDNLKTRLMALSKD